MSTFGETLQAAREFRELSKAELARKMGKKQSWAGYIGQIETRKLQPGAELAVEFAAALELSFNCDPDGWTFRPLR